MKPHRTSGGQLPKLTVILLFLPCIVVAMETKAPHIIFILADDLGWNDVSFTGSPQIPTGNIDALAWNGLRLEQYYTQPVCTPSRAALMTGSYPIRAGLQHHVIWNEEPRGLSLDRKLLPQRLGEMGYANHMLGKWHLGFHEEKYTPTERGFHHHFGYWGGYVDYYNHTKEFLGSPPGSLGLDLRRDLVPQRNYSRTYLTDLLTDEAIRIIQDHPGDKPLFLYLAHQAPHSADAHERLQAPDKYTEGFQDIEDEKRILYAGMVKAMDESVGAVFQALAQKGMLDNSVVVFSSDNGAESEGPNANYGSPWPLKGMKGTPWEGGIRSPAVIWSPLLNVPVRATYDGLFHITDWLPTFYDLAGGDTDNLGDIDGVSQWNALREVDQPPRSEFLVNVDQTENYAAIRMANYKLVKGVAREGKLDQWYPPRGKVVWNTTISRKACESSTVTEVLSMMGRHPVCGQTDCLYAMQVQCGVKNPERICDAAKSPCLFDLSKDPCEYVDVADEHPEVVKTMLERLAHYELEARPPGNLPLDPLSNPDLHDGVWTSWNDRTSGDGGDSERAQSSMQSPGARPEPASSASYLSAAWTLHGILCFQFFVVAFFFFFAHVPHNNLIYRKPCHE
ncbi:arylsulfatase B-like isoform X2 [Ornithodoros turicata]